MPDAPSSKIGQFSKKRVFLKTSAADGSEATLVAVDIVDKPHTPRAHTPVTVPQLPAQPAADGDLGADGRFWYNVELEPPALEPPAGNLVVRGNGWSVLAYTPEQQSRLGVDARGRHIRANADATRAGDVVAVGDVHGCSDCLRRTLQANGVADANGDWAGGTRTVVQLGDLIGRGTDDHGVIRYVQKLAEQAEQAGGRWVQLLGNHELMEMGGDFRHGVDGPGTGFGSRAARQQAFSATGGVGRWLSQLPVVHQWEDVVFAHAGISSRGVAQLGVDGINEAVARRHAEAPARDRAEPAESAVMRQVRQVRDLVLGRGAAPSALDVSNTVLWDRTLAQAPEHHACRLLDEVLEALGAKTMVVGHTITATVGFAPGALGARCGGKLQMVDVGMSDAFGDIPKGHKAAHFFSGADHTWQHSM